jgi:hypothetical protein
VLVERLIEYIPNRSFFCLLFPSYLTFNFPGHCLFLMRVITNKHRDKPLILQAEETMREKRFEYIEVIARGCADLSILGLLSFRSAPTSPLSRTFQIFAPTLLFKSIHILNCVAYPGSFQDGIADIGVRA